MNLDVIHPVFALYAVDAELAAGDVVNGSDLRAGDTQIGPFAMFCSFPQAPAFPVTVGQPLAGTWKAMQPMPSATQWGADNGPTYAVGGYFVRVS